MKLGITICECINPVISGSGAEDQFFCHLPFGVKGKGWCWKCPGPLKGHSNGIGVQL